MGGIYNSLNLNPYAYAHQNPVKYVDPSGLWVNNKDGSFTAEKGDTLWGLGKETGRDWKSTGFDRNPKTLQIGETVSFNPKDTRAGYTVDSTYEAVMHYYLGKGKSVNLGSNTKTLLKNHPDHLEHQKTIIEGTARDEWNYGVDMTWDIYHVGKTGVRYRTTHGTKYSVTTFTGFTDKIHGNDGFWDAQFYKFWVSEDGPGPNRESDAGTVYRYMPYSWTISYPNPKLKKKGKR